MYNSLILAAIHSSLCLYIFHCLDYGNIFWRFRHWIGRRYAQKDEETLKKYDLIFRSLPSTSYDDQYDMSMAAYKSVAAKYWQFTRWICPICFTGFMSVFVMIAYFIFNYQSGESLYQSIGFSLVFFISVYPITHIIGRVTN